jgi:hypothetical protein
MEKEKIIEIINDVENKSNKDLLATSEILEMEFNKTKELIIDLTRHLDTVEKLFDTVANEIEKRTKK